MVTSVQRQYAPRIGIAGSRPVNIRFAEALEEANRVLRGAECDGIFNLQVSEASIDLIHARIEEVTRKRHAAAAPNPMVLAHYNEAYSVINRENDGLIPLTAKINAAQPQLLALRNDWRYRKLGSRILPADAIVTLPLLTTDHFFSKRLETMTTDQSKAALDAVHTKYRETLRLWSLVNTALGFQRQPHDVQLMELMAAAVEDERALKHRITALESVVQALRAIVTKSKRKPKRKAAA